MKIQSTPRPVDAGPARAPTPPAAPEAVAEKQGWAARPVTASATPSGATEARNRALAEQYFEAFGRRDGKALEALYRPDATFKDDMFDLSKRSSILNMWAKAPPFATFTSEIVSAEGNQVKARWVVDYEMFGNKVHNEIESTITFDAQGKISAQHERWDRTKWMSQALPLVPRWAQPVAYFLMRPLLSASMGG